MNDLKHLHPARQKAWWTGCAWDPSLANPVLDQDEWASLIDSDPRVIEIMRRFAGMGEVYYTDACIRAHGYTPADAGAYAIGDGEIGPVMTELANLQRCMVPDYAPLPEARFEMPTAELQAVAAEMQLYQCGGVGQAVGRGNWPKCHGVGDYHSKITMIDTSNIGSHVQANFLEIMKRVREADRLIGLLHHFVDTKQNDIFTGERVPGAVNSRWTFVSGSSGWIGLATVRTNLGCGDTGSWARFLKSYNPQNTVADWTTLFLHEDTHNKGYGHLNSRSSKQNPYIINNLPSTWETDPLLPWLRDAYGGEPVPVEDPGPGPTPDDVRMILEIPQDLKKGKYTLLGRKVE